MKPKNDNYKAFPLKLVLLELIQEFRCCFDGRFLRRAPKLHEELHYHNWNLFHDGAHTNRTI